MIKLKGMTWSHARGIKPLVAASAVFKGIRPDVDIEWDARSLSDFELFPLEQLAGSYDLIMIDHPHIGAAYAQQLLMPLDEMLPQEYLKDQESNSVGLSYKSYCWENHQWALPVDAAAQVSAYRKDLLNIYDINAPVSWPDVIALIDALSPDQKVGIPFVPVHAYSSFFTLCSQMSDQPFWSDGLDLNPEVGVKVLTLLSKLLSKAHKDSFDCDPINMLDRMGTTNEIVYVPLIYGYSNYAREGFLDHVVCFVDMPSDKDVPNGSMIGGVGLAISSKCKRPDIAVAFVEMTAGADFQRTTFFDNAGQPGHRKAWLDDHVNDSSGDFFRNTLATLDHGSMRPRFNGYIEFQEMAGNRIRDFVKGQGTDCISLVHELNALIKTIRESQ